VQRSGGLDASDRLVLARLAAQAAVAAHTVLLAHEVQRAREAVVVAREEERRRLRRDLHDDIGPALAALALQAEAALTLAPDNPDAAAALIARLVPRLNATVGDVRSLVHELRPPSLDELGLTTSVRELAARMSTPDVPVRANVVNLPEFAAAVDVAAYRIVSEAVTNAVRHARASRVDVRLSLEGSSLDIQVTDDGCGLPSEPVLGLGVVVFRGRSPGGFWTVPGTHRARAGSARPGRAGTHQHGDCGSPVRQWEDRAQSRLKRVRQAPRRRPRRGRGAGTRRGPGRAQPATGSDSRSSLAIRAASGR
jgi:hypothetical protein